MLYTVQARHIATAASRVSRDLLNVSLRKITEFVKVAMTDL